jgi:methylenetetrahydrofolate dehydrogenase (NADP+)/methenyltetrahydrofolate cyclohydrolase
MARARRLRGEPVAATVRADVRERVAGLDAPPTLATVVMSDDPADERFVELKHDACAEVGIDVEDRRLAPDAPASRLHRTLENLAADSTVDAVFVQVPLPEHVDLAGVRRRLDPHKDVDCFHPTNLGRLVAGNPRYVPATPAAVGRILAAYGVPVAGREVVIVGRSAAIGRPLTNHLLRKGPGGDATVTVCHSRTPDLGAVTRRADVLVTACGVAELVTGAMLSPGAVVVDVSANRRTTDGDTEVVGDVEHGSAAAVAAAITPVPGGVGPVTLAMLVRNVVRAAERRTEPNRTERGRSRS